MASSSTTIHNPKYDVFLSFRGADTRNNFTSHLYNALRKEGVNVFMDKELKRGEEISSSLFLIIEGSQISIVIFSPNYAASKFCLDELVKILECKTSKQQVVLPVFYKVDPLEVEKLTGDYGKAMSSHEAAYRFKRWICSKETIKEKMEKVKRWKSVLAEAADLAGWDLRNRNEAEVIREIVEHVLHKLHREQLERGRSEGGLTLDEPQTSRELFPEKTLVGESFEINKRVIWAWLTDDDVSNIGIWGMGGVGKTTLLIHIHNKLLDKQEVFGQVYWVTVSQDFSVFRLQNLIAKAIGLEFGTEEDVMIRAARMLKTLSSKGKYVLILDDLWNPFDLEMVGIPIKAKGCQLIITTRISNVCTQMNLQILKIEPLSEEDAWYLFNERLGHDLAANVEVIAKSVVRECDGLPLGIVTMAGSMRGVDDIHEWQNALTELQRSEVRPEDMGDNVFRILGFSYTRLKDWGLQQCVLYCALFPEDYVIAREDLIELLVVEGIIERQESRRVDFDKGHAMLNKLIKVSLLEDVKTVGRTMDVKMHDLIRDMAIQIMKKSSPSVIGAGRQLEHIPDDKYWTKGILRVSLMKNFIREIPSNFSPICHALSTLLFRQNFMLVSIPESFFLHLHGLKVLDLSSTSIRKLPHSVGFLGNLKALLLQRCTNLYDLPSLAKLVSLEMLDLSFCSELTLVPEGLELLFNLTFLNLHRSGIIKLQPGMVRQLYHLQVLAYSGNAGDLDGCDRPNEDSLAMKAEELAELQKLEYLSWCFDTSGEYNKYVRLGGRMQSPTQPISYFIAVGRGYAYKRDINLYRANSREVFFWKCDVGRELFIHKNLRILKLKDVFVHDGNGLCFKIANEMNSAETKLKSLSMFITRCFGILFLFHLSSSPSIFKNLETLELNFMHELCALFGSDGEVPPLAATPLLSRSTTLSCLKQFRITNCNGMKKLFPSGLIFNFKSLETVVVQNCAKIEEIIAAEDEESYHYDHSNLTENGFSLPKLRILKLIHLPKLRTICNGQIVCDSNPEITIVYCPELKKIPISFTMQSLQTHRLRVWPPEWWKSVQWGSPDQKGFLRPKLERHYKPEAKIETQEKEC